MATVTKKKLLSDRLPFSGVPYGNAVNYVASLVTTAAGAMTDGDSTAAIGIGDVVRIGVLDAGFQINDALAIVSDAFAATSTAKIGFAYVDGVDDASVPQDDDYFFAALAINAQGRTAANNLAVRPVVLPKDAYIIVTNQVAAQNVVGALDLVVKGSMVGVSS